MFHLRLACICEECFMACNGKDGASTTFPVGAVTQKYVQDASAGRSLRECVVAGTVWLRWDAQALIEYFTLVVVKAMVACAQAYERSSLEQYDS